MKTKTQNLRTVAGVRERRCSACGKWKPHDAAHFYSHSKGRFGLHTICKPCFRAMARPAAIRRAARIRAHRQQMGQYARDRVRVRVDCVMVFLLPSITVEAPPQIAPPKKAVEK